MKPTRLLFAVSVLVFVSGCAVIEVGRAPIKTEAHFTIAHLEASQVDVLPKLTRIIPTPWSEELRKDERDKYAVVRYIIDTEGMPREVQWVEASDAAFAQAAAASVYQGRFIPAKKAGKAVAVIAESRIRLDGPSRLPSPYNTGGLPENQPSRPWLK